MNGVHVYSARVISVDTDHGQARPIQAFGGGAALERGGAVPLAFIGATRASRRHRHAGNNVNGLPPDRGPLSEPIDVQNVLRDPGENEPLVVYINEGDLESFAAADVVLSVDESGDELTIALLKNRSRLLVNFTECAS